jgi:enoyl-CoA hydratase/carnithine racemase
MTSNFVVTSNGAVARIDLNAPDDGNSITRAGMIELAQLIGTLARDPAHHLVVIESQGEKFCRGRNAKGETSTGMTPFEIREKMMGAVLGVYDAINEAPVPVVALVQGPAVGFGAALAGGCDVTLASDAATFSFPEINHGIAPTLAMSAVLRKIPAKTLMYLIYSADTITAQEAVQFGLASKVYAAGEFAKATAGFVDTMAARPRLILQAIKRYQRHAADVPAAMASEYAGTLMGLVRIST